MRTRELPSLKEEPEVTEFIIAELYHNARGVTDCKHIKVKQLLANFHRLDNREFSEQVLSDAEWSCDMCVFWLESRAVGELTPRMWTRSAFKTPS